MGILSEVNSIAENREKAKKITNKARERRAHGDNRPFAEILQDEINKLKEGEKDEKKI